MDPLHPSGKELPEHATPSEIGHIPAPPVNPRLNSAAESVGSALGAAVSNVRNLPSSLQEAKARLTVIRGRKKQDVQEAADEAMNRIREVGADLKEQARERLDDARERIAEAKDQALKRVDDARERLQQTGARADHLAHEHPLHVMAGAAAFGMLLGIGLRIWRDYAS